jgi:hypothetical protein
MEIERSGTSIFATGLADFSLEGLMNCKAHATGCNIAHESP